MLFNELVNRGLVKQITDRETVSHLLDKCKITFYIGFDPTADSLHVGHLLQIITAKRLKNAGHFPIMLIGGATAQIGDPTGKTEMRKMLDAEELEHNVCNIRRQIIELIPGFISTMNNADWISKLDFLSFIRDVGPHFSVNNMLRADCFKSRMEHGLSFLEFNYMLLQAFDFFHLNSKHSCQLQVGGDDQWANILAGIDLIHKKTCNQAFGLTLPLLTNSDGQKMGKTERGAIWLDKSKTSVFDFFQFWRNIPDADVLKCFKFLTFLSLEEIESLPFTTVSEINTAKKRLAFELTKFVHGEEEASTALKQAEALFENKDTSSMEIVSIAEKTHILDLIMRSGFAKSRTEARNLIMGRGITINDVPITNPIFIITSSQFGHDIIIKKGKKSFRRFIIEENSCLDQIS